MRRRRAAALVVATMAVVAVPTAPAGATPPAPDPDHPAEGDHTLADLPVDVRPIDVQPGELRRVDRGREWADPPEFGPTQTAAVTLTNADTWHAAGIDGTGVKIGVIDFFDVTLYWDTAEHGPAPVAGTTAKCFDEGGDCTATFFDGIEGGGESHGVAVVEVIRDMAPGAQIYIGQAVTAADYRLLIDWFAARGVRVISRSLGSRYDGPGDGRGALDDVAAHAAGRGMVWINSAGNNAINRYYRHPVRLVGDHVAFGPSGNTTRLRFNGCVALGGVRWANDWDVPPAERTDYDVFLYRSKSDEPGSGVVVESSTFNQKAGEPPLEHLFGRHCPDDQGVLYLEIERVAGAPTGDVLEILDYGDGMAQFTQAAYAASTSIVDSKVPAVVAVGAIDPPSSGAIGNYSSQGPTNDGRVAPAVVAPAGFPSATLGETFAGTSASAAVVGGGAALLLDAGLAQPGNSLGQLIRNTTIDRGARGPDHIYGHGEFRLPGPPTPNGAAAPPSAFVPSDAPVRILDTRPATRIGPAGGRFWAGEIRKLPIVGLAGIPPDDVTAVALNVAVVDAEGPGWLQVLPTGEATVGAYSNVNTDGPHQTRANFVVVPVAADGTISLHTTTVTDVIVDLLGWFSTDPPEGAGGRFVPLPNAQRALDTRLEAAGPLAAGTSRRVSWPVGVDHSDIAALVVTVTGAGATSEGWLQAYPADRPSVMATTSTVNMTAGGIVANTAIVPVGGTGVAITGNFAGGGMSHVVVDIVGYITTADAPAVTGGLFVPLRPNRAFDSRRGVGDLTDRQVVTIDAEDAPGVSIPDAATGVVWNLTSVLAHRAGWTRGWAPSAAEPPTSSSNWSQPGETRAAAAVTAVSAGKMHVRMDDGEADLPGPVAGLVVDVFGYFT